ncbi:MAG: CDP-alcohol phosphatidyltransferase family protein [Actinobacteria bacterium]|nr:CDP-alcohol phosphatidyltransferase family protein [Actinomycetota bacterium]
MIDQPPAAIGRTRRRGDQRILTVPNVLTVLRLLCIPLFLYLLFGREDRLAAALLLAALGATDLIDGYIARHFNQASALGAILDPAADRILLGVGVIAILIDGSVPVPVAAALLTREALVAGAVLVLAALGARRVEVTLLGKAGTFANMIAFPLFLASNDGDFTWRGTAHVLGWVFAVLGFVLSWYAAATYIPLAREALRQSRSREGAET